MIKIIAIEIIKNKVASQFTFVNAFSYLALTWMVSKLLYGLAISNGSPGLSITAMVFHGFFSTIGIIIGAYCFFVVNTRKLKIISLLFFLISAAQLIPFFKLKT